MEWSVPGAFERHCCFQITRWTDHAATNDAWKEATAQPFQQQLIAAVQWFG